MTQVAMVVHADESIIRLVSKGLSVFEPQYKVVSVSTLSAADDWAPQEIPLLLLVDGDTNSFEEIREWAVSHGIETSSIFLLSSQPESVVAHDLAGVLSSPMRLSVLLEAVSAYERRSPGVEEMKTMTANDLEETALKVQHTA